LTAGARATITNPTNNIQYPVDWPITGEELYSKIQSKFEVDAKSRGKDSVTNKK
jgi:hypothetical protein